jgi:hypothetical protein
MVYAASIFLPPIGIFVLTFSLLLGVYLLRQKGKIANFQLWSITLFSCAASLAIFLIEGYQNSSMDAASPSNQLPTNISSPTTQYLPILISIVPIVLTILTGVAIAFTRNALVDIREERKKIDEAIALSKKIDDVRKEIDQRSWVIRQHELRAHLLSDIAKLAAFAASNPEDVTKLARLNEIDRLFIGEDVESKIYALQLLVDAPNLRKELSTEHEDFIRDLPKRFPADDRIKALVRQFGETINNDRRKRDVSSNG